MKHARTAEQCEASVRKFRLCTITLNIRSCSGGAWQSKRRCHAPLPCFFAKNSVRIGDRSTVSPSVGSNRTFELGAGTVRGEVTALTGAFFRDQAKLAGTLYIPSESQITYQNRNTVSIKDIELIPGARSWILETKTVVPGSQSVTIEKVTGTCKRTLEPGSYATVTVRPGCTLVLKPGEYNLKELNFDANSFFSVLGPVSINVVQRFNYGDYVKMSGASSPQDVQIYTNHGSDVTILPNSVFTGLLRAPSANVTVMSKVTFNGCIAANNLGVEPDSALTGTRW